MSLAQHPSRPLEAMATQVTAIRDSVAELVRQADTQEENPQLRAALHVIIRDAFELEHRLHDAHMLAVRSGMKASS